MPRKKKEQAAAETEVLALEENGNGVVEETPAPTPAAPRGRRAQKEATENLHPPIDPARRNAIDKTLSDLTKRFGDGAIMRLGEASHMNVESIPTGSLALDIALGIGGVPRGRVTEIY